MMRLEPLTAAMTIAATQAYSDSLWGAFSEMQASEGLDDEHLYLAMLAACEGMAGICLDTLHSLRSIREGVPEDRSRERVERDVQKFAGRVFQSCVNAQELR